MGQQQATAIAPARSSRHLQWQQEGQSQRAHSRASYSPPALWDAAASRPSLSKLFSATPGRAAVNVTIAPTAPGLMGEGVGGIGLGGEGRGGLGGAGRGGMGGAA